MSDFLEEDELQKLPQATIYTKSYIRSLCRLYKIDTETLINKFEHIVKPVQVENPENDSPCQSSDEAEEGQETAKHTKDRRLRLTLSLSIAFIISLVAFNLVHLCNYRMESY